MSKKIKISIIVAIIVIAGLFAYRFFFVRVDEEALTSTSSSANAEVGREVLETLETLETINLDSSVFEREDFRNLKDFSVEIVPDPLGRRNPFAPIGEGNINEGVSPVDDQDEEGLDPTEETQEETEDTEDTGETTQQ